VHHPGGDDAEAGLLKTAIDLADQVLLDAIRLDDGKGALQGNGVLFWGSSES